MTTYTSIIRRAQRRGLINRAIRLSGWGTLAGFGLAFLLLALDWLGGVAVPLIAYPALSAVGFLCGVLAAVVSSPDGRTVATQLDRALRLKDRFGTAQALDEVQKTTGGVHDRTFADLVRLDAERWADRLDVRPLTPIPIPGIWAIVLMGAVLLWLGLSLLPPAPPAGASASSDLAEGNAERPGQQAQELARVIEGAIDNTPSSDFLDEEARSGLEALERLADQLANRAQTDQELEQARDEAAARLDELADQLAQQAERHRDSVEQLARHFEGLDAIDAPDAPLSAREFEEALKRGEFGRAAEELKELIDPPTVREPERHAASEQLRELAEQIDHSISSPNPDLEDRRKNLDEALRDIQLEDRHIDELLDHPESNDDVEEMLRERDLDEELTRDLAHELRKYTNDRLIEEQVQRDLKKLAEALDRTADELEEPPPPRDQKAADQTTEPSQPTEERREADTQPSPQPDAQSTESEDQQVERRAGEEEQMDQAPSDREPTAAEAGEPEEEQRSVSQPDDQPLLVPSDQQATDESPGEVLRRLAERRRVSEEMRKDSERFRELARRLADQMSPEQRTRWAQQWQQATDELQEALVRDSESPAQPESSSRGDPLSSDQPFPPVTSDQSRMSYSATDEVSLTGEEVADEVIAKWVNEEAPGIEALPERTNVSQRVRAAQEIAERAVNDSAVPRRYHRSIKRFFDRLRETLEDAGENTPAEPDSDAAASPSSSSLPKPKNEP